MKTIKQKIKILVVTPYFPPYTGGVQNYVYNIAAGLKKSFDWEIVVVTSKKGIKRVHIEKRDGMKIYHLPVLFNFSNTPINPLWFFQFKIIIHREKPSLINAHAPVPFMADMAALASGSIPFVFSYHTGSMTKGKKLVDFPISMYEKFILPRVFKKSTRIICSSDFIKNTFLHPFADKTVTINPGVSSVEKKSQKRKSTMTVLFVGGLTKSEWYKGVDYLINAVSQVKKLVPNVNLILAGKGDAVGEYKELAKKYHIDDAVTFAGALEKHALDDLYESADVLVLPSASESFGMVLIEAMAHGTPVIASNIGGIPDVVTDGKEGVLVPTKNAKELANAITKVLTNKRLAKKMGDAGYEKVKKNYLWNLQILKTKKLLENVINSFQVMSI